MRFLSTFVKAALGAALSLLTYLGHAQTTDVANNEFNTQLLEGRLLSGGVLYDGLRWNLGATYNRDAFLFLRETAWYEFYGSGVQIINRPFEKLEVQGNGPNNLLRRFLCLLQSFELHCPARDIYRKGG